MRVVLSPEEQEDLLELRMRGSQRARAHRVVQQQCPACGSWMAADLVAEVRRGEQQCPTAARIKAVFREAMADLFGPIERAMGDLYGPIERAIRDERARGGAV